MDFFEPRLYGMNFILRPLKYTDAESLAYHANNPEVAKYLRSTFPHPYRVYDAQEFISWVYKHAHQHVLAIEVAGKAAGAIGIHQTYLIKKPIWEVGYWLGQEYWNKNITSQALALIIDYYAPQLQLKELYATIYEPNIASAKVLLKCGFTLLHSFKGRLLRDASQVNEQLWIKTF